MWTAHGYWQILSEMRAWILFCSCSTEVWNQTGRQNLKMVFNGKSPSVSFSCNHPKFRAHLSIIYYMMKTGKLYVSSNMAGSSLLAQLCFPYTSIPLAPKLWCRMRIPDLAPTEHERSPRNKSACSWPPRAIWDRQMSLTPNPTGQSGQKSGSFLGQHFFATALEPKRTQELELV